MPYCLPVYGDGFPAMTTNPFCKDGWGFLKRGECGCEPGSPGWKAEANGCSVHCQRVGPNDCPGCPKDRTMLYVGIGAAAVAAFFIFGKK